MKELTAEMRLNIINKIAGMTVSENVNKSILREVIKVKDCLICNISDPECVREIHDIDDLAYIFSETADMIFQNQKIRSLIPEYTSHYNLNDFNIMNAKIIRFMTVTNIAPVVTCKLCVECAPYEFKKGEQTQLSNIIWNLVKAMNV